MKIVTVLGTRPEVIRLSEVIRQLDKHADHVLVHTGQHYDTNLSGQFFDELAVRPPDYHLETKADSFAGQVGNIIARSADLFATIKPDRLLILGDTNSGMSAYAAKRMGIGVYHMEAGNRSFDERMPEEINRRVIDHLSDINMAYTERSRANLVREGIPSNRVFVTGNPIGEVMRSFAARNTIASPVLQDMNLTPGQYAVATVHREETIEYPEKLASVMAGLDAVARVLGGPVVCSVHPRTRARLAQYGIAIDDTRVLWCEPFGYRDFVELERNAACLLTDSGTVQEEACLMDLPCVVLRTSNERLETVEAGATIISGLNQDDILRSFNVAMALPRGWKPPHEYMVEHVSATILKILLAGK